MNKLSLTINFLLCVFTCFCQSQEISSEFDFKSRNIVIDSALQKLQRAYVFPDKADEMTKRILKKRSENFYNTMQDQKIFADSLTADLKEISRDGHLWIYYDPSTFAQLISSEKENNIFETESENERKEKQTRNYGFSKLEVLEGNIGYMNLTNFEDLDQESGKRAVSSMNFLSTTSEIIIDLRNNPGGSGRMGQLLSTYFFPEEEDKWLISNINRSEGTNVQEWTLPYVPGSRMPKTPLYILVGPNTGSAAEGFAYNLQALGRAAVVGEPTYGAAHSGSVVALDKGFIMFLPTGRTVNPITHTNWEGSGVQPDIITDVDKSMEAALQQIWTERLSKTNVGNEEAQDIQWILDYLQCEISGIEVPEEDLFSYTGDYEGDRKVQIVNGKLYWSGKGGLLKELRPLDSSTFVLVGALRYGAGNNRISFIKDEKGEVVAMQQSIRHAPGKVAVFQDRKKL